MVMILLVILSIMAGIVFPLLIYHLQKVDEENQELKDIIKNVHKKVILLKDSSICVTASDEIKNILDYMDINTASTTAFKIPVNLLKKIFERNEKD